MSLDRRIVSILYHNGITDVNKVEKFIGENNNYYEVIIDGKIEKLKIPGSIYLDNYDFFEELDDIIQEKKEEFSELLTQIVNPDGTQYVDKNFIDEKILMKERTVEESFLEAEKSTTLLTTTTLTFEEELEKTDAENNNFLEKLETENKKFLDEIKNPVKKEVKKPEVKKTEVKPVAKTKAVKSKKLDDDIDNFIDLA